MRKMMRVTKTSRTRPMSETRGEDRARREEGQGQPPKKSRGVMIAIGMPPAPRNAPTRRRRRAA